MKLIEELREISKKSKAEIEKKKKENLDSALIYKIYNEIIAECRKAAKLGLFGIGLDPDIFPISNEYSEVLVKLRTDGFEIGYGDGVRLKDGARVDYVRWYK